MKSGKYHLLSAALVLAAVSSATAQTVTRVLVGKEVERTQIAAPGVGAITQGANPFSFQTTISATGLSTAPTVTLAAGSTYSAQPGNLHNGGALVINSDGDWGYGGGSGSGAYTTNTNLDTFFQTGNYAVSVPDVSGSVTLALNAVAPGNTANGIPIQPVMTLSGGSWSGGKYIFDVSQTLTITTNSFTGYTTGGIGSFISLSVDGPGGEIDGIRQSSRITVPGATLNEAQDFVSLSFAPYSFVSGTEYEGYGTFVRIVDQLAGTGGLASSFNAGYYAANTEFTISAVPEPSTYAAFAGLGALGIAYWRRRAMRASPIAQRQDA